MIGDIPFKDWNWGMTMEKQIEELIAEVKRLRKQLDSLREFCHKEDYDIHDWEIKNIEVIE